MLRMGSVLRKAESQQQEDRRPVPLLRHLFTDVFVAIVGRLPWSMSPGRALLEKVDQIVDGHGAALVKLRAERFCYHETPHRDHSGWRDEVTRFINSQIAEALNRNELVRIEKHFAAIHDHVARRVAEIAARQWIYH